MLIKDVLKKHEGEAVIGLEGMITTIHDQSTGTHEKFGKWSLQNCEFTDSDGIKILLTFKNCETVPNDMLNKKISISAIHSDKHGWIGAKFAKDKTNNKPKIEITKTGKITIIKENVQDDSVEEYEPNEPVETVETQKEPVKEISEREYWLEKEKRELAGKAWNTCFMTIYPILSVKTTQDEKGDIVRQHSDIEIADICAYFTSRQMQDLFDKKFYDGTQVPF